MLDPSKPTLRGALDGGRRGRVQRIGAIPLAERCELRRRPLDEAPKPGRGKAKHLPYDNVLERHTDDPNQEMKLKEELMFLGTL